MDRTGATVRFGFLHRLKAPVQNNHNLRFNFGLMGDCELLLNMSKLGPYRCNNAARAVTVRIAACGTINISATWIAGDL